MAFLAALRSAPEHAPLGGVVWVRPARTIKPGSDIPYAEIEAQLMLALRQWKAR